MFVDSDEAYMCPRKNKLFVLFHVSAKPVRFVLFVKHHVWVHRSAAACLANNSMLHSEVSKSRQANLGPSLL